MVIDSGDRREFETGAVRDMADGKGRCDLLPLNIIAGLEKNSILFCLGKFLETRENQWLVKAIFKFREEAFVDSYTMWLELAKHFEDGAKKYGDRNWEKGLPEDCFIDSAVRHYLKYLRGDSDERHDRAFVWNCVCCLWTIQKNKKDITKEE